MKNKYLMIAFPLLAFCSDSRTPPDDADYKLVSPFSRLSFERPVDFQQPHDNSNRFFVVEQAGIISVFSSQSPTEKKVFLDIQNKVEDSGNEQGLLGLAFHPDFKTNGYFFVNYTASNPDRTVISRFKVSASDINKADINETVLLTFPQPYSNHNGGQVSFAPDGFLYIATGDGGAGGDPHGNGQNRSTLLGKILRIDVNKQDGSIPYSIPTDNPFARNTNGYRKEIYAYGLRNPWRFSFDDTTHELWTGDVGQNAYEEVDIIVNGGNYGWNTMEGTHCFSPKNNCTTTGLRMPVTEYGRNEGVSITGGFVYRGSKINSLKGKYIYADYVSGNIWSIDNSTPGSPTITKLMKAGFSISSFGVDVSNELYICAFDGKIYQLQSN